MVGVQNIRFDINQWKLITKSLELLRNTEKDQDQKKAINKIVQIIYQRLNPEERDAYTYNLLP